MVERFSIKLLSSLEISRLSRWVVIIKRYVYLMAKSTASNTLFGIQLYYCCTCRVPLSNLSVYVTEIVQANVRNLPYLWSIHVKNMVDLIFFSSTVDSY